MSFKMSIVNNAQLGRVFQWWPTAEVNVGASSSKSTSPVLLPPVEPTKQLFCRCGIFCNTDQVQQQKLLLKYIKTLTLFCERISSLSSPEHDFSVSVI